MHKFEPLKIALDYDDTFTADKAMWANIVMFMKANGCDVRFVTFRHEHPSTFSNEDILQDSDKLSIPIIFCEGVPKKTVTSQRMFHPDIWIDDCPELIPTEDELYNTLLHINRRNRVEIAPQNQQQISTGYSEETLIIPR